VDQFTNAASADTWVWQSWSAPGASAWVSTPDAGGGAAPGSVQLSCNFADVPNNYQQCVFQHNLEMDQNRFVYMDMDVRLDPSSFPMYNGNTYGHFEVILNVNGNWGWVTIGGFDLTASNMTNWTHLSYPVTSPGATNMHAITIKVGGGWAQDGFTNTVIVYLDNIKLWTPQVPPTLSLKPSGPGGLQVTCTAPTDDWQRQNIVTPSGNYAYSWVNAGQPVTYSFTLTNFPDYTANPGFEAHAYLINYDTLPAPIAWNETYGAVDWNAADIINLKVVNSANGGVDFSFTFKTNLPGANIDQNFASIHGDTALGTWALTFHDNTSLTLSGPGVSGDFTLPTEVANAFMGQMFLHFGTFKNRIINNGASATFSKIEVTGVSIPINETFPGPGLNPDPANPFWRLAADPVGLTWIPPGTAYWLTWTLPDVGFSVESSASINGPWSPAGISFVADGTTSRSGAVPATALPSPGTGFFRMVKPNTP